MFLSNSYDKILVCSVRLLKLNVLDFECYIADEMTVNKVALVDNSVFSHLKKAFFILSRINLFVGVLFLICR